MRASRANAPAANFIAILCLSVLPVEPVGGLKRGCRLLQVIEQDIEPSLVAAILDQVASMDDRRAIAPECLADLGHGKTEADMGEVHGDLPGKGCRASRRARGIRTWFWLAEGDPDHRLGNAAGALHLTGSEAADG
jgi:hypothetical protein